MVKEDLSDRAFMVRALELALAGRGRVSPNPMVGAVLVKDGRILGEGFHARAGAPHAEVVALEAAGEAARGATLYVTLEPCCHQGRTPPCGPRIVASGVRRVVAATLDPNPQVGGRGLTLLREAGLRADVGLLEAEAVRLNEVFFTYMTSGRPFVTLKAAISLDGKIATVTGESRWITGEEARRRVHEMRNEVDAVLVGIGTILRDDPLLTTRLGVPGQRDPVRVIVDNLARLPAKARVINSASAAPTLVAVGPKAPAYKVERLREAGATVLVLEQSARRISLAALMQALVAREITSVLIEGGAEIHASALSEGIVDKVAFFLAPLLIGGKTAPSALGGPGIEKLADAVRLRDVRFAPLGEDLLVEGYVLGYPRS
ncbi:MAG: bifunctional diaminohydroxyphosphoribosylaminopyrimidine deaminase/5-amino-6-(5-phosphoribosylamino)uracil reductase RibD [candidate division NC10 bacterium]|nr:bifunctional diaminohydroxyphosphoribosylaminopyrimidine deaminase/5-amino-6-(5-phosphoribosylamino)uracil reductase RibD [candidate division NC10 bacterium]